MLRPYISRVCPYIGRLRPYIGCFPEHPASRQHCLGGPAELRFMLLWEWSFREPNIEARPALNGAELDDSRRSAIDHVD